MEALDIKNKAQKNYRINFWLLVFGRGVSGLGGAVFGFGLSLYVLDMTGSAVTFSFIYSLTILPGVLISMFTGALVDRGNKKKIIVVSDVSGGIIVFFFLIMFSFNPQNIIIIAAYSIISSCISAVFNLAINAAIPEFVGREEVARTNSILQGLSSAIGIVGPILGAIAYKAIGIKPMFALNGIALILAGLAEIFIIYIGSNKLNIEKSSYFKDLKVTFEYINNVRILGFFFAFAAIINFIFNPLMFVVLPYINYNIIKVTGIQLSIMQASGAVGVIVAAVIISVNKILYKRLLIRFLTLFRIQAVLIVLWVFPVLPVFESSSKWYITAVFSILLILYGALNTAQNIPMVTYFQLQIPDHIRARIIGVFVSALYISSPLGMWLYGILLENIQWTYITSISGIVLFVLSLMARRNKYFSAFIREQKQQREQIEKAAQMEELC